MTSQGQPTDNTPTDNAPTDKSVTNEKYNEKYTESFAGEESINAKKKDDSEIEINDDVQETPNEEEKIEE